MTDQSPDPFEPLFYLATFTDDGELYLMLMTELQEPTMAEVFIPVEQAGNKFGVTCYIANKMNWEPAIVEMIILQKYFQEKGLPSI